MAKVLLVEDDLVLAHSIQLWLKGEKHVVEHVAEGNQALELITFSSYEVIILDWELPGLSGIEICRRLRMAQNKVPILMLTGRDSEEHKVTGLDCGADDYLTKPFSLKELSARIRAIVRRSAGVACNVLQAGDVVLDAESHRVTRGGEDIELMPREFAVLEFLMRNKNQVFSSEALLQKLWHTDSDSSREAVRACIKRLRQRIDQSEDEGSSFIETVPKIGYRIRRG
ncbi:MAG TPA: response regulator transcription factor [Candidatus Obscuribacter sp.]|nr:response regulator transcription factor [Candidatus Obscuribacter sp.]HNM50945.1 response regulator transcription factor [Candidatus Obscuribacter sp.]